MEDQANHTLKEGQENLLVVNFGAFLNTKSSLTSFLSLKQSTDEVNLPELSTLRLDDSPQVEDDEHLTVTEGEGDHVCSEECDFCQEDEDCKFSQAP